MEFVFAMSNQQVSTPDGGRHAVQRGQHWPAGDPVVLAAPAGLFSPDGRATMSCTVLPAEDDAPTEQATAAPGEKRGAVRRG